MLILSLPCFLLFLYLLLTRPINKTVRFFVIPAAALYLYTIVLHFLFDYFTGDGLTPSVIYHLVSGLEGVDLSEHSTLVATVALSLGLSTLFPLLLFKKQSRLHSSTNTTTAVPSILLSLLLLVAFAANPLPLASGRLLYLSTKQSELQFSDYFVPATPVQVETEKQKKRNLVVLYLEGFERTYFDEARFPGLVTQLRELENEAITFTDVEQLASSYWTIGGMVASQCGLPLVTPSHANSMSGVDAFYPGAVCLGDILSEQGYKLSYFGGAELAFAGKGAFYKSHGFTTVMGKNELQSQITDQKQMHGWGLYDEALLPLALNEFSRLSQKEQPFVLFLLTLDTHHPNGFLSPACVNHSYGDGASNMLNTFACSDHFAGEFIEQIITSPYAEETVIVVLSDHLSMKNSVNAQLNQGKRRNLFFIITPDRQKKTINKHASSLDIAPTLLGLIGYSGGLGLGVDLLSDTSSLISRLDNLDETLFGWREAMLQFWDFPQVDVALILDVEKATAEMAKKTFQFPFLLTFDKQSRTNFYFENVEKSLDKYWLDQKKETSFVMVNQCRQMWFINDAPDNDDYCVAYGKLGGTIELQQLKGEKIFSPQMFAKMRSTPSSPALYRENIDTIFAQIMGLDVLHAFLSLPRKTTLYITASGYGKYPNMYSLFPWMQKKGVQCVRVPPEKDLFYFLSDSISADRARFPNHTLELFKQGRTGITLQDFMQKHLHETIIISAMDEASSSLSNETRKYLSDLGADLSDFGFRDSFATVLHHGKVIAMEVKTKGLIVLESDALRELGVGRVVSGGKESGNISRIMVNGENHSMQQRGLNIVAISANGTLSKRVFDTYVSEWSGVSIIKATPK